MHLVGAWLRQLLRAGTAAAIVPAAIVAALVVVLVGAGGFGGLGSLRQLVAGPAVPPTQTATVRDRSAPIAPPSRRPTRRPAPAPSASAQAPEPAVTPPPAPEPPVRPPPPPPPPPLPRPPAPAPAPAPPPPPEDSATSDPLPLEPPTQRLVDEVERTLDSVGKLLVAIIERLARLLPPPPR